MRPSLSSSLLSSYTKRGPERPPSGLWGPLRGHSSGLADQRENLVFPVTPGGASLWTRSRAVPGSAPGQPEGPCPYSSQALRLGTGRCPQAAWPGAVVLRAAQSQPGPACGSLSLEPRAASFFPVPCGFPTGRSCSFLTSGEGGHTSLLTLLPRWALRRFAPLPSFLLFRSREACAVHTRC